MLYLFIKDKGKTDIIKKLFLLFFFIISSLLNKSFAYNIVTSLYSQKKKKKRKIKAKCIYIYVYTNFLSI